MRTLAFLLVLGVVAGAGCSSSANDLTCDVIRDPAMCWNDQATMLYACVPRGEIGVLAADRASCTFSDGTKVVFDEALPTDTLELERLGFTIESAGGETCGRFVDTFMNRMELTTAGQTVVSELHAGEDFHVHCADGTTYEAPFDRIFDCAADTPPARPPTDGFDVGTNFVEFLISAQTVTGNLFRCELAI